MHLLLIDPTDVNNGREKKGDESLGMSDDWQSERWTREIQSNGWDEKSFRTLSATENMKLWCVSRSYHTSTHMPLYSYLVMRSLPLSLGRRSYFLLVL